MFLSSIFTLEVITLLNCVVVIAIILFNEKTFHVLVLVLERFIVRRIHCHKFFFLVMVLRLILANPHNEHKQLAGNHFPTCIIPHTIQETKADK